MYKNSHFRAFSALLLKPIVPESTGITSSPGGYLPIPILHIFLLLWNILQGNFKKKNPACRILRLRRAASNGNSPFIAVQSCPAGLSSVLILLKYCIHQLLCIRLFRLIDNIIRLPALHHFSVIQNQHLIAETLYKCKIMADKYKG